MTSTIIIDYGSGNLRSVARALIAVAEAETDIIEVSADPEKVRKAARLVLPGVGAFEACRAGLGRQRGLVSALTHSVCERHVPFLGICVGMQLMAERGLEYGESPGFGWIQGEAAALPINSPPKDEKKGETLALPHMGWNNLRQTQKHPLFDGMDGQNVYFAHSFALRNLNEDNIAATSDYGQPFVAAVVCANMIGTQFHPEKSQKAGLELLRRFLNWQP